MRFKNRTWARQYTSASTDHEREEHWQLEAACAGKSEFFQVIEEGSPNAGGATGRDLKQLNLYAFSVAEKICSRCPVIQECHLSAEEDDQTHTYRAGLLPTAFNPVHRGRPRKKNCPPHLEGVACKNGHVGQWIARKGRPPRCHQCKYEGDPRNAGRDYETSRVYGTNECSNGHVGSYTTAASGKRYCAQCSRDRTNERRQKAKAARMGA